jgi:HAD superfamily hydrolase (TIGR01490 family)
MSLAIFDLDETLLAADSDHVWGKFIVEKGLVDAQAYGRQNDLFYQDYKAGRLDMHAYMEFVLRPLAGMAVGRLKELQEEYLLSKVEGLILPKAVDLLDWHRKNGDELLIITATNDIVTAPIAARLGVKNLIATHAEIAGGRVTGKVAGVPSFREGKVTRLNEWLEKSGMPLEGSCFYSDSHNDLPLLEFVQRPVAVDPDPKLREIAEKRGWEIISLR